MNINYRMCTQCVMDTTDVEISFNDDGICNHCINYFNQINKLPKGEERELQLNRIINKIKQNGKGKEYDCIIGLSGGVDSTYVAYYVKKVLGLRPLAVHLDNGWNSELSVMNIENIVKTLEIDLFTYVIDWEEFKDIQLSFLKSSTPDSEIPTDHAIFTILRKMSKKYKVDYVINGINLRTEGHHPLSWSQGHSDFGYIKTVQKIFGSKKIKTFPHGNFFTIIEDRLSSKWINILNYVDYNKDAAKKLISTELGWRDYGGKHFESIYTRFYQGYILPKKFSIDKRKMHFSSLICAGEMTREQAIKYLQEETYPIELQIEDKEYAIKKFGITDEEFNEIMNRPVKSYFDYDSYYGKLIKSKSLKKLIQLVKRFIK